MRTNRSVALVCAGTISRAEITRVPNLISHLGPIKAASMRVASRAANTFRAGYAVQTYEDLNEAPLILISAPGDRAPELIEDMSQAELNWPRKTVVLTGSSLDSNALACFETKGASVGSLHIEDCPGVPLCIFEGQEAAFRSLKQIMGRHGGKLLWIRQGDMPRCFAALGLSSHCFVPLLDASVQALLEAGLSPAQAEQVADRLILRSLRSYAKAGKASWSPVPRDFMLDKSAHIRPKNANLAAYYSAMCDLAGIWMDKNSEPVT